MIFTETSNYLTQHKIETNNIEFKDYINNNKFNFAHPHIDLITRQIIYDIWHIPDDTLELKYFTKDKHGVYPLFNKTNILILINSLLNRHRSQICISSYDKMIYSRTLERLVKILFEFFNNRKFSFDESIVEVMKDNLFMKVFCDVLAKEFKANIDNIEKLYENYFRAFFNVIFIINILFLL